MKTTVSRISAAFAAVIALVSCVGENLPDNGSFGKQAKVREIAVSYSVKETKSTIDGLTPRFVAGDIIKVSNGSASENCTVSVQGEVAFIRTSLEGTLIAVYPSSAAEMSGNAIAGVKVPAFQDGTFASANICKASIAEGVNSASFENQTAVFKITPPSGVKQFTITSLKPVVDGIARTGIAEPINTEGEDDESKLVVKVGNGKDARETFYVSLVAGVNLSDLSFEYVSDSAHGAMKGLSVKNITSNVTAVNNLYTIDENNWHPYVIIEGRKWATMNIGANSPEENGYYFAWGETTGHKANSDNTGFEDYSFDWPTTPFNNGASSFDETYFNSVEETEFPNGVLALKNDAAYINWGGAWRMPTQQEFDTFDSHFTTLDRSWGKGGVTYGTSPNLIFFPFAGVGWQTGIIAYGSEGYFWASSKHNTVSDSAFDLDVWDLATFQLYMTCDHGGTIRPISD